MMGLLLICTVMPTLYGQAYGEPVVERIAIDGSKATADGVEADPAGLEVAPQPDGAIILRHAKTDIGAETWAVLTPRGSTYDLEWLIDGELAKDGSLATVASWKKGNCVPQGSAK